ncbi:MAG: hypothetical protein ABI811_00790 [Acidobacteriota bacterium]
MKLFAFILIAVPVWAQMPLDLVVLAEESSLASSALRAAHLDTLHAGDRVAFMTFRDKTVLRMGFVEDKRAMDHAFYGYKIRRNPKSTRLWDAVSEAAHLFTGPADPARQRTILVLFSQPNESKRETPESVRRLLVRGDISLSAMALTKPAAAHWVQVAPRTPPVYSPLARRNLARPDDRTVEGVEQIAAVSHGAMIDAKDPAMMFAATRAASATGSQRQSEERVQ